MHTWLKKAAEDYTDKEYQQLKRLLGAKTPIYSCEHNRTVFEDCDQCEIIWLQARIAAYELKLALRRSQLKELLRKKGKNQT